MVNFRDLKPGQGAPKSVRGVSVVRDTPHGLVAQAWPKPRGPARTFAQHWYQALFGYAARWSAQAEPRSYQTAVHWTEGSDIMPRDMLTGLAFGRILEVFDVSGAQWPVNAHRVREVSKMTLPFEGVIVDTPSQQNLTANVAKNVDWPSPPIDTLTLWDAANPDRFTFTQNGLVAFASGGVRYGTNGTQFDFITIRKNDTTNLAGMQSNHSGTNFVSINAGPLLVGNGDYLTLHAFSSINNTIESDPLTFFRMLVMRLENF